MKKGNSPCDKLILCLEEPIFKTSIIFKLVTNLLALLEKFVLYSKERSLRMRRRCCIFQT